MSEKIQTYKEFWPFYLQEHSNRNCRRLHYLGSSLAILSFILLILFQQPLFILLALITGYGPAWIAHFFVEKNRPATFTYPLWSIYSDFRLYFLWIGGKLPQELKKARIS